MLGVLALLGLGIVLGIAAALHPDKDRQRGLLRLYKYGILLMLLCIPGATLLDAYLPFTPKTLSATLLLNILEPLALAGGLIITYYILKQIPIPENNSSSSSAKK